MQRKTAQEQCERLRNLEPTALRRQCARVVADHAPAIAAACPELPPALNDRAADIWEPLFALADLAGGRWPQLAREAALALAAGAQEQNPIGSLLLDIFLLFLEVKADRLFSRTLVARLNGLSARPWAEMRNGKEITDLWLSLQLRPYGVRPRTMRQGDLQAKGYFQEDFMEVFRRYIPKTELEPLLAETTAATTPPASTSPTHEPATCNL